MNRAFLKSIFILPLLTFISSCSDGVKTYPTKGIITYKEDGKPFKGLVYFEAVAPPHSRSMATTNADGSFILSTVKEASGTVDGEQVVRVDIDTSDDEQVKNKGKLIHPKYTDFTTSPLRVRVESNKENNFKIVIEKPALK